jgi:ribonuclease R
MLLANEAVAGVLIDRDLPLPARVHSGPDDERFEEYRQFLTALGVTYRGVPESAELQRLVESTADDPLSDVVQIGLLRTMGHAEYVSGAGEHFALATSRYCHFTSPIRRYPDLLVHQILDDWLDGKLRTARRRQEWLGRLPATLEQSSEMERRAEDAERALLRLRMIRYLEDRVDEEMRARIVSVRQYGFYVRVDENLVEGLVHISSLGDDYFEFEPDRLQLVGRRGGDEYAIGDEVIVRLDEVLPDTREIGFRIVRKLRAKGGAGRQRRGTGSPASQERKKKDGRPPPRARRGNQRRGRRRRG